MRTPPTLPRPLIMKHHQSILKSRLSCRRLRTANPRIYQYPFISCLFTNKLAASCLNPWLIFHPLFKSLSNLTWGTSVMLSCQTASSEKPNLSPNLSMTDEKKKKSPRQPVLSLNRLFFLYEAKMRLVHGHQHTKSRMRAIFYHSDLCGNL